MHNYSTYGKTISSDLSLSLLNPCNIKQDCDIIIKSSKLDIKQREEINSKKSFFIKNNVGMFEIRNGNEILYKTFPKFSPLLLEKNNSLHFASNSFISERLYSSSRKLFSYKW